MVILFQELKIKSISNFSLKDGCKLNKSLFGSRVLFFTAVFDLFFNKLQNLLLVRLVLLITDIKSNLISIKIRFIHLNQFFKK